MSRPLIVCELCERPADLLLLLAPATNRKLEVGAPSRAEWQTNPSDVQLAASY